MFFHNHENGYTMFPQNGPKIISQLIIHALNRGEATTGTTATSYNVKLLKFKILLPSSRPIFINLNFKHLMFHIITFIRCSSRHIVVNLLQCFFNFFKKSQKYEFYNSLRITSSIKIKKSALF